MLMKLAKRRRAFGAVDHEDLVQDASIAVLRARSKFDPSRGVKWKWYAARRASGSMLDSLRLNDHVPRLERARARKDGRELPVVLSFDRQPIQVNEQGGAKAIRYDQAESNDFWGWASRIGGPVLNLYFRQGLTLKEAGRKLGLSESRACQLLARGLKKLKRFLKETA